MRQKLDFKPSDINKLYKAQAVKYSQFAEDSYSWKFIEKPLIDKIILGINKCSTKILDAGCGSGRILKYLVDNGIPPNNLTGVDMNAEMVSIAMNHVSSVKIIQADLTKFAPKEHYDVIICTHVLHYLNNKDFKKTLSNFYKILHKKGKLFFVLTHPVRTTHNNLSDYFKNEWIIDHTPWGTTSPLFLRTVSKIVNDTIEAGFTITALEEPELPLNAKKADSINYEKYSSSPSRIAVLATK